MILQDELRFAFQSAVRRFIPLVILSGLVGFGMYELSVRVPRNWTTEFVLVAETETSGGGTSLAAELGLATAASQGPDFYADFLQSPEAFYDIVRKRYKRQDGDSISLPELLAIPAGDSDVVYAKAARKLVGLTSVSVSRRAGTVTAAVHLPDRSISKDVADALVMAITLLNDRVRQTKGRAERVFNEGRLEIAQAELDEAEDSIRVFLERNRMIGGSPTLQVEQLRRERQVARKQQVMTTIELAYEAARSEEVRNTPRVSIIAPPRVPALGDARGTVRKVVLAGGITFGLLLVLFWLADRRGGGSIIGLVRKETGRLFAAPEARHRT